MTWALDLIEDQLVEEDHLNPLKGDLPSHSYLLLDFYQNLVAWTRHETDETHLENSCPFRNYLGHIHVRSKTHPKD